MEELKAELIRSLIIILQVLTGLAVVWVGNQVLKIKLQQRENQHKLEETRENVSRLINGKGVAHDHDRAIREIHGVAPNNDPPKVAESASENQSPISETNSAP